MLRAEYSAKLPPLLRHATVFSAVGGACSLAVPLVFKQLGI